MFGNRANALAVEKNIKKGEIQGTNAWKLNYQGDHKYKYDFSYDSPEINDIYGNYYSLVEVRAFDYPLNNFYFS